MHLMDAQPLAQGLTVNSDGSLQLCGGASAEQKHGQAALPEKLMVLPQTTEAYAHVPDLLGSQFFREGHSRE